MDIIDGRFSGHVKDYLFVFIDKYALLNCIMHEGFKLGKAFAREV